MPLEKTLWLSRRKLARPKRHFRLTSTRNGPSAIPARMNPSATDEEIRVAVIGGPKVTLDEMPTPQSSSRRILRMNNADKPLKRILVRLDLPAQPQ